MRAIIGIVGIAILAGACSAIDQKQAPAQLAPLSSPVTLEAHFKAHAREVLEAPLRFSKTSEGFAVKTREGVMVTLPTRGDEAVHLLGRGLDVRVHERGTTGLAREAKSSIGYVTAKGGATYWTARGGAVEEWIHGIATPGEPLASWTVAGATFEPSGIDARLVTADGRAIGIEARRAYAPNGDAVKVTLRAHGDTLDLYADAKGEVLVDPIWSLGPALSVPRANFTATVLKNGNVLVAGGVDDTGAALQTYEVFDVATLKWSKPKMMTSAHAFHTATLANNGHVIVGGGIGANLIQVDVVEDYDPQADTFTALPMGILFGAVSSHAATLLSDGTILFSGGYQGEGISDQTALLDPVTGMWTPFSTLTAPRHDHTVTEVAGGDLIVAGGANYQGELPYYERYITSDPGFYARAQLLQPRSEATATLLPDGNVLLAGGYAANYGALSFNEIIDTVKDGVIGANGFLNTGRDEGTATTLPDKTVLFVGGFNPTIIATVLGDPVTPLTEIYSPIDGTYTADSDLVIARGAHQTVLVDKGKRVMVIGGDELLAPTATVETYPLKGALGWPGEVCQIASDCVTNSCVDAVCCDTPCDGPCSACIANKGAPQDGTCTAINEGKPCDDKAHCILAGKCTAGTCGPTDCAPGNGDPCVGQPSCDQGTGKCLTPSVPDGAPCPGGVCIAGGCVKDPEATTSSGAGGGASSGTGAGAGSSGAGAGSSGVGTSGTSGSGDTSNGNNSASSSCSMSPVSSPVSLASVGLFALALAARRRRRVAG
jgi:MYXO-CTERM domain-containing protein